MPTCVYDNPSTMCREWWDNGKLTAFVTAQLLENKAFRKCYPKTRPWKTGEIIGDKEALNTSPQS